METGKSIWLILVLWLITGQVDMKNKLHKKIFALIIFIGILVPAVSFAAEIKIESESHESSLNSQWLLSVYLNPNKDSINAVEGSLIVPTQLLDVVEIRDGNSAVSLWVKRPKLEGGKIIFSGITPDGFANKKQYLFSVVLNSKLVGEGEVTLKEARALLNDGLGKDAKLKITAFDFRISDQGESGKKIEEVADKDLPEDFAVTVAKDSSLFDGKYFAVFSTQDKKSGIDHYELREGLWGSYKKVESPYVLEDQSLGKNIYVKAFDNSGNVREVVLKGSVYRDYRILFIILVIILVFLIYKKWRKNLS